MNREKFNEFWTSKGRTATDTDYKAYLLGQQVSQNTVEGQQQLIAQQIKLASNPPQPRSGAPPPPIADHHPTQPYQTWAEYRGNLTSMGYGVNQKDYDNYLRSQGLSTQGDHEINQQNIHKNEQGTTSISKTVPDHIHDEKHGDSTAKGAGSDFVDDNTNVHHDSIVPGWKPKFKDYGEDRGPPPTQTEGTIRPKPTKPDSGDENTQPPTTPANPSPSTNRRPIVPPVPAQPTLPQQRTQPYTYPYKNLPFDPTRQPPEVGDDFYSSKYQSVLEKWGLDNWDRYQKKQPLLPKPLPPPETMLR